MEERDEVESSAYNVLKKRKRAPKDSIYISNLV